MYTQSIEDYTAAVDRDEVPAALFFDLDGTHECAYCGGAVTKHPAVVWRGASEIVLHPECAAPLVTRLLMDAYHARAKSVDGVDGVPGR